MPGLSHVMGLPFNVCNVVGRTYADADVFAVGAPLERERPWLDVPARRPVLPRTRRV